MAYFLGKISKKISKNKVEYFVGTVAGIPVRGFWGKKNQGDLHIVADDEKISFLAKKSKAPVAVAEVTEK